MENIITILAMGIVCMACFHIGAKVGQAIVKGEKIETPTINPMEAVKKHQAKKLEEMEQNRFDTILRNIEAYDGTERGQEDVPGR